MWITLRLGFKHRVFPADSSLPPLHRGNPVGKSSCGSFGEERDSPSCPARAEMTLSVHPAGYPGILLYTMRVSFTNYNQYALIFVKMQFKHILFYEATLYGRLSHQSLWNQVLGHTQGGTPCPQRHQSLLHFKPLSMGQGSTHYFSNIYGLTLG